MKKYLTFVATLFILVTGCSTTNHDNKALINELHERVKTLESKQDGIIKKAIPFLYQYELYLNERTDSVVKGRI